MIGIYQLRNTVSGRCYIGQSKDIAHRWNCHLYDLRNGRHRNAELQADFDAGQEIVAEVVCECSPDDLDNLERYFIKCRADECGSYNISPGVSESGGNIFAESSRRKLSESKKGNTAMVGKRLSDEWRKHLSEAQPHRKRIECVDTGEVYESFADAARKTGLNRTKIVSVCTGKRKTTGGMRFRYDE